MGNIKYVWDAQMWPVLQRLLRRSARQEVTAGQDHTACSVNSIMPHDEQVCSCVLPMRCGFTFVNAQPARSRGTRDRGPQLILTDGPGGKRLQSATLRTRCLDVMRGAFSESFEEMRRHIVLWAAAASAYRFCCFLLFQNGTESTGESKTTLHLQWHDS